MEKKDYIKYWLESSKHDLLTAERIFETKNYDWALFVGHLSIEKLLKAFWIKNQSENFPPRTHNLIKVAEECELLLTEEDRLFLLDLNGFNIETRYPDYKLEFYHKCTKEFSEQYLEKIKEFYNCTIKKI